MFDLHPATIILVAAVSLYTAVAAVWDFRFKRIPNTLTLPMFFAGWVYQIVVSLLYGWQHLGSAALGFLIGFGLLFVLWFVGGGGGGDVKLVGALSVWLGYKLTLWVLFVSTILVLFATMGVVLYTIATHGLRRTQKKYLATKKDPQGRSEQRRPESRDEKLGRRVMAYAGPVAVATWLVMFWNLPRVERSWQPPPVKAVTSQVLEGAAR